MISSIWLLLPMIFGKPNLSANSSLQQNILAGHTRGIERALDQHEQMVGVKGLGQENRRPPASPP